MPEHYTLLNFLIQKSILETKIRSVLKVTIKDLFPKHMRLLEEDANINIKKKSGQTTLSRATKIDYSALVKQLLDNNANINIKDIDGKTALF